MPKRMSMRVAWLSSLLWITVGCAVSPGSDPPPGGNPDGGYTPPGVDPCATADCSNVVDAVVLRLLAEHGLPSLPEDNGVLCRRMAIDLNGIGPTPREIDTQCTGHTAKEIADYFMNKPTGVNVPDGSPPYVFINRRWWADSFQYQATSSTGQTWYAFARELDQVVGDLYSGKISYDVFAERALGSPAFLRRFGFFNSNVDLIQIAAQAFRVFLGREALPSEADDFGNLFRAWSVVYMDDAVSRTKYPDCTLANCNHYDLGLVAGNCAGPLRSSCQSISLGAAEVVPPSAGTVRWPDFTQAETTAVGAPGRLMAAQPEFAEAAVDHALIKYLGWWKQGFFRPDFDVPAVRDALAKKLVADQFDIRKLEREIVTSVLYTQQSARQPSENLLDPIWAFGPTKALYAEAWLDTLGQATGKKLGGCDFVYSIPSTPLPGAMKFPTSGGIAATFYKTAAGDLGGCPAASLHTDPTGLVAAISRRTTLAAICPASWKPTMGMGNDSIVTLEFPGIGRDPTVDERQTAVARMASCDPKVDVCTPQGIADALCTSLYASAFYTYY